MTIAVLGVDTLRSEAPAEPAGPGAAALLVGGTFAGFVLAPAFAWWLLAPIQSLYRRTALAIGSSFGTVVLMLIGVPVHQRFGQPGLAGLAFGLAIGTAAFALRARRAARDP